MQSNTVERQNGEVNFPESSAETGEHRSDSFSIRDRHFVGHDGFIVPRDFAEFYTRFPDYVHRWVRKHAGKSALPEDVEDWSQDLLLHLYSLPQESKFRDMGKQDAVETFDPVRHHGANEARFRNYVNVCLANKFRTMHSKRRKDALGRPGNVSFNEHTEGNDPGSADSEYCAAHSEALRTAAATHEKQARDRLLLQEFMEFVKRGHRKGLRPIAALLLNRTRRDASDWLGITESEFAQIVCRLRELKKYFLNGEPVPKPKKALAIAGRQLAVK